MRKDRTIEKREGDSKEARIGPQFCQSKVCRLATPFCHLGLVLAINLVEQSPKDKYGTHSSHRLDLMTKYNGR